MDWDRQTIKEWDELGFYYEYDKNLKQWRFFGSKNGLNNFVKLIEKYTEEPSNNGNSEHIHIGPYNYLKIMTWNETLISENSIAGTLKDLIRLKNIILDKLVVVKVGQIFKIGNEYSINDTPYMLFVVMKDEFLPSTIEF